MREAKIVTDSIKDQIYQILKEDILTGESCSGKRQMAPLEVRILKTEK